MTQDPDVTSPSDRSPGAARGRYLAWLARQLQGFGLAASVVETGDAATLRVVGAAGQAQYIACCPAPQQGSWAWVWSYGWALVSDPYALMMIVEAMKS